MSRADEAIETAAGILIDHLELFKNFTDRVKQDAQEEEEPEEQSELDKLLEMPLKAGNFHEGVCCLKRQTSIQWVVIQKTEAEIRGEEHGQKSLAEVKGKLAELGWLFAWKTNGEEAKWVTLDLTDLQRNARHFFAAW